MAISQQLDPELQSRQRECAEEEKKMRNLVGVLVIGSLFATSLEAIAQQRAPDLKTIPDSMNFIWKDIAHDFIALAEAMPEEKWNFKPTQGELPACARLANRSSMSLAETRVGRNK